MELSGDFVGTVKQDRQYMAGESQPGVSSKDMAAKIGYGKLRMEYAKDEYLRCEQDNKENLEEI